MKYHKTEPPRTVKNQDEENQLEGEWHNSPADVHKEKEKEPQRVILSDLPKLNGDADTLIEPAENTGNDEPAEPLGDVTEPKTGKKKK